MVICWEILGELWQKGIVNCSPSSAYSFSWLHDGVGLRLFSSWRPCCELGRLVVLGKQTKGWAAGWGMGSNWAGCSGNNA